MEWLLLILLMGLLGWAISTYNGMVKLRNQVNEAWAGIDVQLQLRYELVPNLLATVKGYMQHESSVLERVSHLRGEPGMSLQQRAGEESGLSRSLGKLFALAEAYPELKASEGFQQLHQSLVNIEDQLQY
ncbi:MAG TPA: LemA family protein, partial [Xanthomonadales bacterium]|nr:LemA family protein [Xanthomonadales bacterium]